MAAPPTAAITTTVTKSDKVPFFTLTPYQLQYVVEGCSCFIFILTIFLAESDVNNLTASPESTYAYWTANGSWEGHQWGYYGWNFTLVNKYGKQGLRCARPVPP